MNFEIFFREQINNHLSIQPQDVLKLCYQAAFGAEHLLQDIERAKNYLKEEYEKVTAKDIVLYESISDDICRVNLAAWKYNGLPVQWLFPMLAESPFQDMEREKMFCRYLEIAERIALEHSDFSLTEWNDYLKEYQKSGLHPVHHSQNYREKEQPAYRIVDKKYVRIFPLLRQIAKVIGNKQVCVIAIDGRAASGKTTMAKQLSKILQAEIIQMDDFFLPLGLRTPERFEAPGGNVHYERFAEEVIPYLSSKESFSYRIFDCSKMDYNGVRKIESDHIRVVEGSYSCHPYFGNYADITAFSDVNAEEQMERIYKRNGEKMAKMFQKRWIPLEERYFREYKIPLNVDLILK